MKERREQLTVYCPSPSFPTVSVTGTRCDLMCGHCRAAYLKGMKNGDSARKIKEIINGILSAGGEGMLLSGGCDVKGRVPVVNFTDEIRYAAERGLKVNVHAGLVSREDAELLVKAGVKAFSADVHQDRAVIKNVLHLDAGPEAYAEMLDNIISAGGNAVAHITAGFGAEDLFASADLIKSRGIGDVTLLVLTPTAGTVTEDTLISEDAAADAVTALMKMGLRVTLGCMRPRVHRNLEIKCIEAGVRSIANPSLATISWAKDRFDIVEKRTCCCFKDR